jgi:hypothetical protein
MYGVGVLECGSVGFKSGNRPDFYSFTFGYARSKHGLYFFIISNIYHSITPSLQYSRYYQPPPLIKSGALPFTNGSAIHPRQRYYLLQVNR